MVEVVHDAAVVALSLTIASTTGIGGSGAGDQEQQSALSIMRKSSQLRHRTTL
jgi:hypothetical protein